MQHKQRCSAWALALARHRHLRQRRGSTAVPSNCCALPWQGDPGDPGEDGAKGARGDAGSPGLPGERVGAGFLVREAVGQQDGQSSAGKPGVLVCRSWWASTQDPLLSPPCPTAEYVFLLQGVEGPRGPPGARVSAPFPLGGLTGVSAPCSAPVQGGRCSLLFPPRRVTPGTEACQERR